MYKQMKRYMKDHPMYNGFVHLIIGVGIGALLTYSVFGSHPVRWGVALIAVGLLGHLYPTMSKK